MEQSRREFLSDVGKGMLVATVGASLATDLGISSALADSPRQALSFGSLEPLVELMQESPVDRLLPALVTRINQGTDLRTMVAAAALANARTFGGEDYIGFHTFMALVPAYEMSRELPADRRALPILKVLYRNSNQIQALGGRSHEVLHEVAGADSPGSEGDLRDFVHHADTERAERAFAAIARRSPKDAFDALQPIVEDDTDVHRTVLAYRAWSILGLTGKEHAHTLLRQSVRYCLKTEQGRISRGGAEPEIRKVLPKLLDQYGLVGRRLGTKAADDAWVDKMAELLMTAKPDQAADAVAAALAEGFSPQTIGECLSLAANLQVLRDPGRTGSQVQPGKPAGSVHGDSPGVHSSDSMNAWRNIAAVSNHRNTVASLVVGGYHVAHGKGGDGRWAHPFEMHREAVAAIAPESLLSEADRAVREQNQARAAAIIERYGSLSLPVRPVFDMLLKYGTSEDGSLHAEKYYRTVREEFERTRPAFRWRQVVALARVTASEYGRRAAGYEEACSLLKVQPS